jgi:hypothetical protein
MNGMPPKCVVDTGVAVKANDAVNPDKIPDDLLTCVDECVKWIGHVVSNGGLVIDAGNEIYDEYCKNLNIWSSRQPGVGVKFVKWVHDHRWSFPDTDRVEITKNNDSYDEFPNHPDLSSFDPSDRKFIAVANAHPQRPPVLQAVDSKWWGYSDAFAEAGVDILFLCPDYIKAKYEKKMGRE